MKRSLLLGCGMAIALTLPAQAGNMAAPIMEPEVIVEESTGTAGGWVVPLILIAVIAAVASASSGGGDTPVPPPVPQLQ
jgi:hypothetical protein